MVTWVLQGVGLTFNPFVVRFGVEGGMEESREGGEGKKVGAGERERDGGRQSEGGERQR